MTERFLWSKVGTSMKIRLWFNDARGTPLLMTANGRLYAKETNKLETFCFIFKLTARWLRKYLLTWHSMRVMQLLDVPRKLSTLYRSPRVQPLSFFLILFRLWWFIGLLERHFLDYITFYLSSFWVQFYASRLCLLSFLWESVPRGKKPIKCRRFNAAE